MRFLIAGLLFWILFTVSFGILVWRNSDSQTIVFSFCAVVGASFMFLLTLFFELRSHSEQYIVPTRVALIEKPTHIVHGFYALSNKNSQEVNLKVSGWLAKENHGPTMQVFKHFTMYSLIRLLLSEESDWKKQTEKFVSVTISTSRALGKQKGSDTFLTANELSKELKKSKNLFSELSLSFGDGSKGLYLPPQSSVTINGDTLTISNPYCEIMIELKDDEGKHHGYSEKLGKYEFGNINLNIIVTYKKIYAKSKSMPKYKKWVERFVAKVEETFLREQDLRILL